MDRPTEHHSVGQMVLVMGGSKANQIDATLLRQKEHPMACLTGQMMVDSMADSMAAAKESQLGKQFLQAQ